MKRLHYNSGFKKDHFEFCDSFPFVWLEILFRISPLPVSKRPHCDPYQHANFLNLQVQLFSQHSVKYILSRH